MKIFNRLHGLAMRFKVQESELSALVVRLQVGRSDLAALSKLSLNFVLVPVVGKVLTVHVGECVHGWLLTVRTFDKATNAHRLLANLHAVNFFNGLLSSLLSLIVDKAVATRLSLWRSRNLAGEDVPKETEGIVQRFVVDVTVQISDENVTEATLAKAWIALAPHDAASTALDARVVQGVQGTLSITDAVEIHIAIAERLPGDTVAAHADGGHGSHRVEDFVEHGLGDIWVKVTDVQRRELRDSS
mmetsp:Transcript_76146/g.120378  ORF Transcript_76146/g.120378 Transcript_76146/m.120378 type:complete len:245 (+) Transcript_76146:154-888(+)